MVLCSICRMVLVVLLLNLFRLFLHSQIWRTRQRTASCVICILWLLWGLSHWLIQWLSVWIASFGLWGSFSVSIQGFDTHSNLAFLKLFQWHVRLPFFMISMLWTLWMLLFESTYSYGFCLLPRLSLLERALSLLLLEAFWQEFVALLRQERHRLVHQAAINSLIGCRVLIRARFCGYKILVVSRSRSCGWAGTLFTWLLSTLLTR